MKTQPAAPKLGRISYKTAAYEALRICRLLYPWQMLPLTLLLGVLLSCNGDAVPATAHIFIPNHNRIWVEPTFPKLPTPPTRHIFIIHIDHSRDLIAT